MLTPQDIENKMFKISFKGYNTEEVDDFLQQICDSYVELYMESKKYREQNGLLSEAVGQYKSMEGTLQDALSVADKSTGEIEKDAHRKAEAIIKNAEQTAADIVAGAKQKTELELQRFNEIQKKIEIYKEKITDLLNAQVSILSGYPASVTERTETIDTKPVREAKKKEEMKTEDLPTIRMNKKGEYVNAE